MRRAGKTTFLRQLQAERRDAGHPERTVYLSFDDDRLTDLPMEQLGLVLEEYFRRYPELRGRETVRWLLDEVQLVNGWERFVRRVLDTERMEIVVSGSSARMLSREVHTSLRGRGMETVFRPFSFREFLRHRGAEPTKHAREFTAADRSRIEREFREYLITGGFPEAQGLPGGLRVDLLQGYVDTVLFRDVVERHGITQEAALRWLTRPVPEKSGRRPERAPAESGPEGAGAWRCQGRRARNDGASAGHVSHQRGGAGHGFRATSQLQPPESLSGGYGTHQQCSTIYSSCTLILRCNIKCVCNESILMATICCLVTDDSY